MSSLQHLHQPYEKIIHDLDNSSSLAAPINTDTHPQMTNRVHRITSALQTTLDIHKLLAIFYHETMKWIPLDSIRYRNPELNIALLLGDQKKHTVEYTLTITNEHLGDITFSSRSKFTQGERHSLENLLSALIHPLRNAIAYQRAIQAALHDPLTGVCNRAAMDASIIREIELAHRHQTPLSLLAIDVDHFKRINDTFGHATGDAALCNIVDTIVSTVRSSDMVFRYGGEEFLVLLTNTHREGATLVAERIRHNVHQKKISYNNKTLSASISLGVAWLESKDSSQSMLSKADTALYAAKTAGRNCVKQATR